MRLSRTWPRIAAVLLAAATGFAWGGEKIQFSGRSKDGETPQARDLQAPFAAPNFNQGAKPSGPNSDTLAPVLTHSANNRKPLTKEEKEKLEAELEKKRNWVFQKEGDESTKNESRLSKVNKQESDDPEEMFAKRPKNSVEKFLTDDDSRQSGRGATNRVDQARQAAMERDEQQPFFGAPGGSGTNGVARSDRDFNGTQGTDPAGVYVPTFGASRTENVFRPVTGEREKPLLSSQRSGEFSGARREDPRLEEFRKLLAPTPINGNKTSDLTREEADPLTGRGFGGAKDNSSLNLLGTLGEGSGGQAKTFNSLNVGGATPLLQPEATRPAPKPAVLEIPKRVF